MPIISSAVVSWVACDPESPKQYKGTGPFKWSVQVSTGNKKEAEAWAKEYGMKMTPYEGPDSKIHYKSTLSTYAFAKDDGEGKPKKNKPVTVILMNGEAIDPNTVGNGSVANVSFYVSEDKETRRLKGIQVSKLLVYTPVGKDDEFELSDDFEIVESDGARSGSDDEPY